MYCWRVSLLVQSSRRWGCLHASFHRLSSLNTQQTFRTRGLLNPSTLTQWSRKPPFRTQIFFTTKRRKFLPQYAKDGVDPSMPLIYENNMKRYYFWSQLIINAMGVPSLVMCSYIIISQWHMQDFSMTGGVPVATIYFLFYGFLMAVVNGLCHRSIMRVYSDAASKKFTAVARDWKFTKTKINFDLSQVSRKTPGEFFGVFFGNMTIRKRPFMLAPTDFVQPIFFNKFMGYDLHRSIEQEGIKDIDLKDHFQSLKPVVKEKTPVTEKEKLKKRQ